MTAIRKIAVKPILDHPPQHGAQPSAIDLLEDRRETAERTGQDDLEFGRDIVALGRELRATPGCITRESPVV